MTIKLSNNEQVVYDMIPSRGETTTHVLVKKIYGNNIPLHGQKIISGIVRSLEKKTEKNKVRVRRGPRSGPHPILVWKEKNE
jgi:hypothetical protein